VGPHICCITCIRLLTGCLTVLVKCPSLFRYGAAGNITDSYLYVRNILAITAKSNRNLPSSVRPVSHSEDMSVRTLPEAWNECHENEMTKNRITYWWQISWCRSVVRIILFIDRDSFNISNRPQCSSQWFEIFKNQFELWLLNWKVVIVYRTGIFGREFHIPKQAKCPYNICQ
jgi:hypothetical protein